MFFGDFKLISFGIGEFKYVMLVLICDVVVVVFDGFVLYLVIVGLDVLCMLIVYWFECCYGLLVVDLVM